jgi:GntR family transcriptional repressor for pyruvate dehydrogenase complex
MNYKQPSKQEAISLRPIERTAVSQQILSRLKAYLDQESMKVGSKLPSERQLAAMLSVSRPSIREALKALSILGIVKPKQGHGTYLASSLRKTLNRPEEILTLQESLDLAELAEARLAIEPHVASLAAQRVSKEDLALIREELDSMRHNLNDRPQFLHHDLQFHLCINRVCHNGVLRRMMSVVLETLFGHFGRVAENYGDLAKILSLHENIYEALRRHDPRKARSAMIQHMRVSQNENRRLSHQAPVKSKGPSRNHPKHLPDEQMDAPTISPNERV